MKRRYDAPHAADFAIFWGVTAAREAIEAYILILPTILGLIVFNRQAPCWPRSITALPAGTC